MRTVVERRCVRQQRKHEEHHWYDSRRDQFAKCDGTIPRFEWKLICDTCRVECYDMAHADKHEQEHPGNWPDTEQHWVQLVQVEVNQPTLPMENAS